MHDRRHAGEGEGGERGGGGGGWQSRKHERSASRRRPEVHIKQKSAFFLLISGVFKCLSLVQYWPGKSRLSGSRVVYAIIQELLSDPLGLKIGISAQAPTGDKMIGYSSIIINTLCSILYSHFYFF